jgi:serine protease Do
LLLDQGHFWSGLENIYLNEELCKSLNVPQTGALLVLKVVPVSLGGKLGLRGGNFNATIEGQPIMLGGDIILEVDGIALNNRENLEKLSDHLGELVPGALIKVKILREGKVQELKASLPVD